MIEIDDAPDLIDPIVIAAFEGWNDAAESASAAIDHLMRVWNARVVGAVDPDDFYDFQVNRPRVELDEHDQREISWPTTELKVAQLPDGRDLVLILGLEPNLRWRQFATLLASALRVLYAITPLRTSSLLRLLRSNRWRTALGGPVARGGAGAHSR